MSKFRQKYDFSDARTPWKVSVFGVILVTFYAVPANPKQTILELGSTVLFYFSFPVSHLIRKEITTTIFYHVCTKNCLIINIYNIIINVYNWRGFHQFFFVFVFVLFFCVAVAVAISVFVVAAVAKQILRCKKIKKLKTWKFEIKKIEKLSKILRTYWGWLISKIWIH